MIATDVIRQVLRAFFTTRRCRPCTTAFEAGGISGYRDQAELGTGIGHRRAGRERGQAGGGGGRTWCPAASTRARERCVLVEALVVVEDAELHIGHFSARPGTRPAERYLARFEDIRRLQDHLWDGRARRRRGHRQRQRRRHARPADGAGAGRRRGGPRREFGAAHVRAEERRARGQPARRPPRDRVELGLEGFRTKRKGDLIAAILDATGEDADGDEATEDTSDGGHVRGDLLGRHVRGHVGRHLREGTSEDEESEESQEKEPEREEELASGVLDILANGSGFVRVDPAGQSRDDVYVSPAQIRRCELRAGDELSATVRPPRRNERHPSLVRVATVNGADAEPPRSAWFGELSPVFPSARLPAPPRSPTCRSDAAHAWRSPARPGRAPARSA